VGRRSHSRALGVWSNGLRVGRWEIPASGLSEFSYDASWTRRSEARPLSLSLPLNFENAPIQGARVNFFFENLLPDSTLIRERIRSRYHTPSGDAMDLLLAVGRDCVGALQLLPEGESPQGLEKIEVTSLSDLALERELIRVRSDQTLEDEDTFRISIAGAQEKTGFTLEKGKWCRPHGSTPTTHIFKLALGLIGGKQIDMRESLENEWLCARLLEGYGVSVAESTLRTFGETKVLIVKRFDRKLHSSKKYWLRLPQEDLCQATGTPGAQKYEADGGPGIRAIARVLQGSTERSADLKTLMQSQLLFWMLAATDGHAKNFSIHILPEGRYRLAPLYDVFSAWPVVGSRHNQVHKKKLKLAMAHHGKNANYHWVDVSRSLLNTTARHCGMGDEIEAVIEEFAKRTPEVIEKVGAQLPDGFPLVLFDSVTQGLRSSAKSLSKMKA
jgi:serine/threonine-protein kinase HipA